MQATTRRFDPCCKPSPRYCQGTLTQAFMPAALQDQTDQLLGSQAALLTAIQSVQMELQQQNART